jgi:hypothetical protein
VAPIGEHDRRRQPAEVERRRAARGLVEVVDVEDHAAVAGAEGAEVLEVQIADDRLRRPGRQRIVAERRPVGHEQVERAAQEGKWRRAQPVELEPQPGCVPAGADEAPVVTNDRRERVAHGDGCGHGIPSLGPGAYLSYRWRSASRDCTGSRRRCQA